MSSAELNVWARVASSLVFMTSPIQTVLSLRSIHNVLNDRLATIQAAMETELAQTSLDEVVIATEKKLKNNLFPRKQVVFIEYFSRCN